MEHTQKNLNRQSASVLFALLYGATYLPATWLLKNYTFNQPVAVIITIIPIITFGIFIYKYIKAISVMDEVKQRIQLEAVVIGLALTVMLLTLLFLLNLANIATSNWFNFGNLIGFCWLFYFIGWFISHRKYSA